MKEMCNFAAQNTARTLIKGYFVTHFVTHEFQRAV